MNDETQPVDVNDPDIQVFHIKQRGTPMSWMHHALTLQGILSYRGYEPRNFDIWYYEYDETKFSLLCERKKYVL